MKNFVIVLQDGNLHTAFFTNADYSIEDIDRYFLYLNSNRDTEISSSVSPDQKSEIHTATVTSCGVSSLVSIEVLRA